MTGIFGGAFDPPHNGHVAVARAALEKLGLERLRVTVVAAPGHKEVEAPAEARLELARAAFGELPRTTVEREEHARTVDALEAADDDGDRVLLIGADEWRDFWTWRSPERVLELARIAVATRPGVEIHVPPEHAERVTQFEVEPVPVSSSEIRRRVAAGESIANCVPPRVAALVAALGLYRS